MPSQSLAIRDNPDRHRFEVDLGDGNLAVAEYLLRPGKVLFTHTEVPKEHGGKGIGTALIRFALDAARERGLEVVPICPFFADYMRSHPDVQDLLDAESRARLSVESPD